MRVTEMRYQSNKKQTNRKEDTVKLLRFSDLGSNMAGTVKRPAQTACPLLLLLLLAVFYGQRRPFPRFE